MGIGFNWKLALSAFANFLLLFFILKKLVFTKVVKSLQDRQKKIEEIDIKSIRIEEELKKSNVKVQEIVDEANVKANKIIQKGQEEAQHSAKEIISKTEEQIEELHTKSQKRIDSEKQLVLDEIKHDSVDIIVNSVEKIIGEKISKSIDKKLIDEALNTL